MKKLCWLPDDPRLKTILDSSEAVKWIQGYEPDCSDQRAQKNKILEACDGNPDILIRSFLPGHITASALVISEDLSMVLLHHHAKLNRWLQFGGHCDGDGNLAFSALRECQEESGISDLWIFPRVIDVDIHVIPRIKEEPEHQHLDVRFIVFGKKSHKPCVSSESNEVRWFDIEKVDSLDTDGSVLRLVKKAQSFPWKKTMEQMGSV